MESRNVQVGHQKQVFLVACSVGLIVLAVYSIRNFLGGNIEAMWIHILMALIVAGGGGGLLLGAEPRIAFRVVLLGAGVGLLCLAAFTPTFLFYHLVMPFLLFFFLV